MCQSLEVYLTREYPFTVIADPDGGYVVTFPDLPGCMTQVESLDELPEMVADARNGWLAAAYAQGLDIPLPSYPEEYSGKFVVRVPRSLHGRLVEAAERDGVSLNQYVVAILARGDAQRRVEQRLTALEDQLANIQNRLSHQVAELPVSPR